MGRIHHRIPVAEAEIYANNLKTPGLFVGPEGSSTSGVLHFVLEKFRTLLAETPFQEVDMDIFSSGSDPKFAAVRRTKKALLIPDSGSREGFTLEDPSLINYEKEIDFDLAETIAGYKKSGIRSEIIYPILFPNHSGEYVAIGYIWIKDRISSLSKDNVNELHNLANSIVEEIRRLSESRTDVRFKVMDISFSGVRLRIHDDMLTEPLVRAQKFVFDLIHNDGNPIEIKALLRWWSKESDGLLDLGLEIEEIVGAKSDKDRFVKSINLLRRIESGSVEGVETVLKSPKGSEIGKKRNSAYQNKRILHIDSDVRSLDEVRSILVDSGYEVDSASSLADGLSKCLSFNPCLIIADTNFPGLDPVKILRALRKISPGSMFIIFSSQGTQDRLIHYLSWIWAYLEKSDNDDMLLESVHEAMDFHARKMSQFHLAKANEEDLTGEIEWLLWKDYHRNTEQLSLGKNILNNVTHSTSQGLGLGSLLIQLDLAEYLMKEEGEEYLIPVEIMNSILENKRVLREWTEKLEKIRQLFHLKISKEKISTRKITERISETIRNLTGFADIKKNQVVFTDKIQDHSVVSSLEFVDFTLHELLVNALKFSPQNSKIHILTHSKTDSFCVDILNEIEVYDGGVSGIPEKFSSTVFEPFSRLNHNYDERFFSVDFGLGIGLNLANHLGSQAGGKLSIREVTDYSGEKQVKRVAAEICFPIVSFEAETSGNLSSHSAAFLPSY